MNVRFYARIAGDYGYLAGEEPAHVKVETSPPGGCPEEKNPSAFSDRIQGLVESCWVSCCHDCQINASNGFPFYLTGNILLVRVQDEACSHFARHVTASFE